MTPQQARTIQPPATPGGAYVVGAPVTGVPTTIAELKALRAKRSELSSQIQNVTSRRDDLADQLAKVDQTARKGIQDRISVIDARILKLENELSTTGEALANTSPALLSAESSVPQSFGNFPVNVAKDIVPIVAILSVFVLGPMALAFSRFIWRRAGSPPKAPLTDQATQQRLDQLLQAVDTIAIEVERISEGQRFISKALADRALSSGAAEPVKQAAKAAAPVSR